MSEHEKTLTINEIYHSIQGESTLAGCPCVFVRLTYCNLRCNYCDTEHAFYDGIKRSLGEIADAVAGYKCSLVEITGGEPLLQKNVLPLMSMLCDSGYTVLLETSGALPIAGVPGGVRRIVDFKCPDSGEEPRNDWRNVEALRPGDEVKFVIGSRRDYEWARQKIRDHRLHERATILLSPVWESDVRRSLAEWMLEDRLPARYQLQIHKLIWPGVERGV